jgi:hypothetical protein
VTGPSKDIEPSALWLALAKSERPFRVVDFPRNDADGNPIGKIAIRVLTQEEQIICSSAAEKFTREHLKDAKKDELGYEAVYSNAACVELLSRACRNVDNIEQPAFPSAKLLSQQMTAGEVSMLFEHYLTVQLELGPIVAHMSDAEMEAWVQRIGQGGEQFPLDLLSPEMLKALLRFSASRIVSSRTDKSSVGSPPESSEANGLDRSDVIED